jgi:hypothetical protein
VAVNFPADIVGSQMYADRHLRNMFETGQGGGDDRLRAGYERRAFGDAVDELPAHERPKYAAVNWQNRPEGAAPTYGHSVLVLNKDRLRDHLTLTPANSSASRPHQVAHAHEPLNALARHSKALHAAGLPTGEHEDTFWSPYTEVQAWGRVPIDREHVQEIRLYRPGPTASAEAHHHTAQVEKMARELGIPVRYHNDT